MTQDTPSRHQDKILIRVPDGLRDRIAMRAKANRRSVNAELVETLLAFYPPNPPVESIIDLIKTTISTDMHFKKSELRFSFVNLLKEYQLYLEQELKRETKRGDKRAENA